MNTSVAKYKKKKRVSTWSLAAALLFLIAGLTSESLYGQAGSWKAPTWADTITNPLHAKPAVIAEGKALFNAICYVCHGKTGVGNGINAASLSKKPANLTSNAVQKQSDGALFWKITEGNPPMLSFKQTLSEKRRWKVIHYVRTLAKTGAETSTATASTGAKNASGNKSLESNAIKTEAAEKNEKTAETVSASEETNKDKLVFNPYEGISSGEKLFKGICASCHSIGRGVIIGPDLKNVTQRRSMEWLYAWVSCSQCLVKKGDPEAVAIFEKFNKQIMVNHDYLAKSQVTSIFTYIENQSEEEPKSASTAPVTRASGGGSAPFSGQGSSGTAAPYSASRDPVLSNAIYWILSGVLLFVLVVLYSLKNVIDALATAYKKQSSKI